MALGALGLRTGATDAPLIVTVPPSTTITPGPANTQVKYTGTSSMNVSGRVSAVADTLVVAGGGAGNYSLYVPSSKYVGGVDYAGPGGVGGQVVYTPASSLSNDTYTITIGAGGSSQTYPSPVPAVGNPSSIVATSPTGPSITASASPSAYPVVPGNPLAGLGGPGGAPTNNAGSAGTPAPGNRDPGGPGGAGVPTPFGTFGGGGGGGAHRLPAPSPGGTRPLASLGGTGGSGGGGSGGPAPYAGPAGAGVAGTVNTGGGGGGGGLTIDQVSAPSGAGGSGVVIISFPISTRIIKT